MRAVVVRETGGTGVLRFEDVERPSPGPRDVLIRVAACGVCRLDVVTRNGTYRQRVELPIIPGHEVCGTVVDTGSAVRRFRGTRLCPAVVCRDRSGDAADHRGPMSAA